MINSNDLFMVKGFFGATLIGITAGLGIRAGTELYDSIRNKAISLFGYETKEIKTQNFPLYGYAICYFLSKKLNINDFIPHTENLTFNFVGKSLQYCVPQKDFKYKEINAFSGNFIIRVVDGTGPDNFVFHLSGSNLNNRITKIVNEYKDFFYKRREETMLIPSFIYRKYWIFTPQLKSTIIPSKVCRQIQEEVVSYILNHEDDISKSHLRGILLYGCPGTGKSYVVNLIGEATRRPIYFPDNESSGHNFLNSITKIPSGSIVSIADIDRIFSRQNNKNNLHPDILITMFDQLPSDVLVIFSTNNREALTGILGLLENPSRISKTFEFHENNEYFDI